MDRKRQQQDKQQDESVLTDKQRFGKSKSDEKLAHMGDKPQKPSKRSGSASTTKKES